MKSQARGPQRSARRNNKSRRDLPSPRTKRRPFLESLEPRQMMTIEPIPGTPFWDWPGNYNPPQTAQLASTDYLSGPAGGDPVALARNYLQQQGTQFGLSATDLNKAVVTNSYTDASSGISYVYFQQTFNGLPVADAHANVSLSKDGRVIAAAASFVRNLTYPPTNTPPAAAISAQQALDVFAANAYLTGNTTATNVTSPANGGDQSTTLSDSDISSDPIIARLQYVPSPSGGVDLGWELIVKPKTETPHWLDVAIGASGPRTSEVTRVADWVDNATYTVFARPVQDPLYGNQSVVTNPQDSLASPWGWHDLNFVPGPDTTDTTGNNVIAQAPSPNTQTTQSVPVGSLNFNSTFDPTLTPLANQDAQVTNLFYWANLAHDVSYHYGFDEASGNFQFAHRSGVGVPNDPIIALDQAVVQGFPVFNNAFMATPADGQSPTMAMGVFNFLPPGTPLRSTSVDGSIILHEFFHGVSNRLTGGPANVSALQNLQSRGMGEGWGDWFANVLTIKPGDTPFTPRAIGQWVLGETLTGLGVRRFPYSTDMSVNPLTLGNYNGDVFPQQNNTEVHNAGEIWASALWDMTWKLINKYGYSDDVYNGQGGNNIAMRLVLQGLKLQPVNPSFMQARDAIISADLALNGGANYELIWQAFARRGFGYAANTPGSNSLFVTEAMDNPPPLGHVRGTVFNDVDQDAKRDAGEPSLGGITVYHDANRNNKLDAGERSVVTQPDGSYDIAFVTSELVYIRQALTSDYTQTLPAKNGSRAVFVTSGETVSGQDFGDKASPGKISGFKFNDLNANGAFDEGEPPLSRVVIYVDVNNDGKLSAMEPSAVTDNYGRFLILNVQPGSYTVREVLAPGHEQTIPGPLAAVPFAYTGIVVLPSRTTPLVIFADTTSEDFGDAPDSYGTTLARNGARAGILPGFYLGTRIDGEPDGQPSDGADGDDTNPLPPDPLPDPPPPSPDDEDGVVFVAGGISPGTVATIQVTANASSRSPGRLQGWVDFNQNGKFDASERVVSNLLLPTGTRTVSFMVPATALQGSTYARFRYGYENDLGPTGPSAAGEVEDYRVIVLPNTPVAAADSFPRTGDALIREDSVDYALDVLANDPNTVFGPPAIVPGSFPAVLPGTGSTLTLNATKDRILYTAGPGVVAGQKETFTYQVTDGHSVSAPGQVTINVSLANPIALDDTFTLAANDVLGTTGQLAVMLNDLFPLPDTQIVDVQFVPQDINDIQDTQLSVDGSDQTLLDFQAPPNFRGTEVYRYTIDDNDPTTLPSSALVTIQVVDAGASDTQLLAAGYQAVLSAVLLDPNTNQPTSNLILNQGETFSVRVTGRDIRAGGDATNRGVQSAYLDLLFDRTKVEPVLSDDGLGFVITFDPRYSEVRHGTPNSPAAGAIDEAGASMGQLATGPGKGDVTVFTVLMRAIGSTTTATQIVADPADESVFTVTLSGDPNDPDPNNRGPVELDDNDVFLNATGKLTIFGAGEGDFVNRANPLDVNSDNVVAPNDVLLVINNLNVGGSRSLVGLKNNFSAGTPVQGMVDTNMDSSLSPADALAIINYINSRPRTHVIGEGEGSDGDSADSPSSAINTSLMGLLAWDVGSMNASAASSSPAVLLDSGSAGATAETGSSASSSSTSSSATGSTSTTSGASVDAAAADDVFAELATAQSVLKQKYRR